MKCPICQRPEAPAFKPFCSRRCAEIDLGHWLSDSYAIAPRPDEEEDSQDDS